MKKVTVDLKVESAFCELSEQVKALPRIEGGKIREVPAELRRQVLRWVSRSGLSPEEVGPRIGLSGSSIRGWEPPRRLKKGLRASSPKGKKQQKEKKRKNSRSSPGPKGFRPIQVREPQNGGKVSAPVDASLLTLELPGGARVQGLSLEDLKSLVGSRGLGT